MIVCVNGFACLSNQEIPLAKAGVNPGRPQDGVVPLRAPVKPAPEAPAAPSSPQTSHIDLRV